MIKEFNLKTKYSIRLKKTILYLEGGNKNVSSY